MISSVVILGATQRASKSQPNMNSSCLPINCKLAHNLLSLHRCTQPVICIYWVLTCPPTTERVWIAAILNEYPNGLQRIHLPCRVEAGTQKVSQYFTCNMQTCHLVPQLLSSTAANPSFPIVKLKVTTKTAMVLKEHNNTSNLFFL